MHSIFGLVVCLSADRHNGYLPAGRVHLTTINIMNYKVYVLRSKINGHLYKGVTNNLERRLKEHNTGKTIYTRKFKPWDLVYYEEFDTFEEARDREKFLKSGMGREFLTHILDS